MDQLMDDLIGRFHELHDDLIKTVEGLPAEALDFIPGKEMNPITVLVVHLLGAERYWVGVALDEASDRNREAEFKTTGLTADDLIGRINAQEDYIRNALGRLSLADLGSMHISPRNKKSMSAGWCILHALEHSALHLGHAQIGRQLWEQRHG